MPTIHTIHYRVLRDATFVQLSNKTAVSIFCITVRFGCLKNRSFGVQLSASATQRTMSGFLRFNALQ